MIKLKELLTVKSADGRDWQILVLDTFKVYDYPEKEYVAYTFGEEAGPDTMKSYISVLNETPEYFSLDAMTDSEENMIVKEAYLNMLLESGDLQ